MLLGIDLTAKSWKYDVLCCGILVADVFSSPLDKLPQAGMLKIVERIYPNTGGCAANTGVALATLGARAILMGKVGNDVFGDFIIQDMKRKGLDTSGIKVSQSMPTSNTIIIPVTGEDRRYIHVIGANADLTVEDINREIVTKSRAVYFGGFLLQPRLDQRALRTLFQFAKERSILTALDVIVPADAQYDVGNTVADVLPYTDVFLPNTDEAGLITGSKDPFKQAEIFSDLGCKIVVITMGDKGTIVKTRKETLYAEAFQVDVVEPSGAGDAFDAAFMWGLLKGWNLRRIIEFASALGASACLALGCCLGLFTEPEALKFIRDNKLKIKRIA
jgi:sugar/nucleoside kinase (ribokinase family)